MAQAPLAHVGLLTFINVSVMLKIAAFVGVLAGGSYWNDKLSVIGGVRRGTISA